MIVSLLSNPNSGSEKDTSPVFMLISTLILVSSILEFLCASGYLARKSYGKMDELISQANLLRMNKGD